MINTDALQRLRVIEKVLIKLAIDGQTVISFYDREEIPVIKVAPGFTEHETVEKGYKIATYEGVRVIWADNI